MKKSLLSIGLLAGLFSAVAQQPSIHLEDSSVMYVGGESLVYNGGGLQTKGEGLLDIHGNVMIVGTSNDVFRTLESNGSTDKTSAGDNIILRLNDEVNYNTSTYGQLYITGIPQAKMPAIVKKEYRANSHGAYQQISLPFYLKSLASLSQDLGGVNFSNQRRNPSVMYWDNNGMPQFHHFTSLQNIGEKSQRDADPVLHNGAGRYYIIGTPTGGWNPSAQIKSISGKLYSDVVPITHNLKNAGYDADTGQPIPYGVGTGTNMNSYRERVFTYLHDEADRNTQGLFNSTAGSESGTYGRSIYQFGNPFMTNIDLSTIGYDEDGTGTGDDGNAICGIQAVRWEGTGVNLVQGGVNGGNVSVKSISYAANGVPTGDINQAIIKPMQAFAIKMKNNNCSSDRVLNFNTLRRFSSQARKIQGGQAVNPYGVALERNGRNNSTVKQLRVIGFDANGLEVGRTYFVVADQFKTGVYNGATVQIGTTTSVDLFTKEESPVGGADASLSDDLAPMYINEANQTDFEGKKMHLETKLANVKNYRFEIAENALSFNDGQSDFLDGGKSFYIEQVPGQVVKITHNMVIPAVAAESGLYYGIPNAGLLSVGENKFAAESELHIAHEKKSNTHQVIFPAKWKKATVTIFDMSGRKISENREVDASRNFELPLKVEGAYIVEVVSDKGVKAVKKVVK